MAHHWLPLKLDANRRKKKNKIYWFCQSINQVNGMSHISSHEWMTYYNIYESIQFFISSTNLNNFDEIINKISH